MWLRSRMQEDCQLQNRRSKDLPPSINLNPAVRL
jgi:hypothetical protein